MRGHWIVVAAAAHVRRGRGGGFMQVCHGKAGSLKRIKAGDGVVYYSPTETFGGHDRLQAFTAIGVVRAGDPYQVDMGGGFRPYRKNVAWMDSEPAAIKSLLDALDFASGKSNWGYQLRYGQLAINAHDFRLIAAAMGATIDAYAA